MLLDSSFVGMMKGRILGNRPAIISRDGALGPLRAAVEVLF